MAARVTYQKLEEVSDMFTVAAAFGNVHGVYSPGNVKLEPEILNRAQAFISDKLGDNAPSDKKPVSFVFHGGSGSDVSDIQNAISYGVIKMNIDTDTQWSYCEFFRIFFVGKGCSIALPGGRILTASSCLSSFFALFVVTIRGGDQEFRVQVPRLPPGTDRQPRGPG